MAGLGLLNLAENLVWVDSNGIQHSLASSVASDPSKGVWWSMGTYTDSSNQTHRLLYKVWPDPLAYKSVKVVRYDDWNGNLNLSENDFNQLSHQSILYREEANGYVVLGLVKYDGDPSGRILRVVPLFVRLTNAGIVEDISNDWFQLTDVGWNNPFTWLSGSTYTKINVQQNVTLNRDSSSNFVATINIDGEGSVPQYDPNTGLEIPGSGIWSHQENFTIQAGIINENCDFGSNPSTSVSALGQINIPMELNMTEQKTHYDSTTGNVVNDGNSYTGIATVTVTLEDGTSLNMRTNPNNQSESYAELTIPYENSGASSNQFWFDVPRNDTGLTRNIIVTAQGYYSHTHILTQDPAIEYKIGFDNSTWYQPSASTIVINNPISNTINILARVSDDNWDTYDSYNGIISINSNDTSIINYGGNTTDGYYLQPVGNGTTDVQIDINGVYWTFRITSSVSIATSYVGFMDTTSGSTQVADYGNVVNNPTIYISTLNPITSGPVIIGLYEDSGLNSSDLGLTMSHNNSSSDVQINDKLSQSGEIELYRSNNSTGTINTTFTIDISRNNNNLGTITVDINAPYN